MTLKISYLCISQTINDDTYYVSLLSQYSVLKICFFSRQGQLSRGPGACCACLYTFGALLPKLVSRIITTHSRIKDKQPERLKIKTR